MSKPARVEEQIDPETDEGDEMTAEERARLNACLSQAIENPRVNGSALGFDESGNRIRLTGFDESGRPLLFHG